MSLWGSGVTPDLPMHHDEVNLKNLAERRTFNASCRHLSVLLCNLSSLRVLFARLFPSVGPPAEKEEKSSSKSSSMVMRRHGRKDGRKEGTIVDTTR